MTTSFSTIPTTNLMEALANLADHVTRMTAEHFERNKYGWTAPKAVIDAAGKRYARIYQVGEHGDATRKQIWCFVDSVNGDVLKPASWKAPAKHARGNVFDPASWQKFTTYGPQYLR